MKAGSLVKPLVRRAASQASIVNRRRKAAFMTAYATEHAVRSVLFVGVGGEWLPETHIVELGAAKVAIFCVGADLHPVDSPWAYVQADGLRLPFRNNAFDLVLSNAVIEHVGGEAEQRQFVAEHVRVGRRWIVTTPNRWFPLESHTRTAFKHWSPVWRANRTHAFTRLMSRREFADLLPGESRIRGSNLHPTFTAYGPDGGVAGSTRPTISPGTS